MSVPLPTVPENQEAGAETADDASVSQAKHEAAEIIARARRQAEAIVAEARSQGGAPSPLAALGDNAEEIIGQVRKLIKKQRQLQDERAAMQEEIAGLQAERDELVQRLTDAVERMEELARIANDAESAPPPSPPPVDTEPKREATSLAARLEAAEREEREKAARNKASDEIGDEPPARPMRTLSENPDDDDEGQYLLGSDGRSFYSRHSAKLPRLEGDGGRSVLSVVGDMRPDPDPKGRKGRRRKKN